MKFIKNGDALINLNCVGIIDFRTANSALYLRVGEKVIEIKIVPAKFEECKKLISDFVLNTSQILDVTSLVRIDGEEIVVDLEMLDLKFVDVAKTLVNLQDASVSLIQRKFNMQYNQAARIIDQLVDTKIVSVPTSEGNRKVLINNEVDLISHLTGIGIKI